MTIDFHVLLTPNVLGAGVQHPERGGPYSSLEIAHGYADVKELNLLARIS